MRKIVLFLCFCFFVQVASAQKMRDVFAAMPDRIIPVMTKNNRLDCIDFIENNMEAKVRNRFDGFSVLHDLTADYLRLQVTPATELQMKVLSMPDSAYCVCVVWTQTADSLSDSRIELYDADWNPMLSDKVLPVVSHDAFWQRPTSMSKETYKALKEQQDIFFVKVTLDPETVILTYTLEPFRLQQDTGAAAAIHPLQYVWNGKRFVRLK